MSRSLLRSTLLLAGSLLISLWSADAPPTVTTAAAATPAIVTSKTTKLTVLGADDGGAANLLYTWSASGPATVTFSTTNGTNAAKSLTATFSAVGTYDLTATIADSVGQTVTSTVPVTVSATLTSLTISPASAAVNPLATKVFVATAKNQFGVVMPDLPLTWMATGNGAVDAGLFTASEMPGAAGVAVSTGGKTATAAIRVNAAPTVAVAAATETPVVAGKTAVFTVQGADDANVDLLTYTWSATGPKSVSFSPRSSTKGETTTATFGAAGSYAITATITDKEGLTASSVTAVSVVQTPTGLSIAPSTNVAVNPGSTKAFAATVKDQFNALMVEQPAVTWAVAAGLGSIDQSGTYTAVEPAGSATISATVGAATGAVSLRINAAPTVAVAAATETPVVAGKTAVFTVQGADDASVDLLTYTWSATGPKSVSFSPRSSTKGETTTATFGAAGSYAITATITDKEGLTASSTIMVTVMQTVTALAVSPSSNVVINPGLTKPFIATTRDQFNALMVPQPLATWVVTSGNGSIGSDGIYLAGDPGQATVTASVGSVAGSATLRTNAPPTVVQAVATDTPTITGLTAAFRVQGADDVDPSLLSYGWSASGPKSVSFAPRSGTTAAATTATFTGAGTYTITATITDKQGLKTTSSLVVTVQQVPTGYALYPSSAVLNPKVAKAFVVQARDQYNATIVGAVIPAVTWSATGGAIDSTGRYVAGTMSGTGLVTAVVAATDPVTLTAEIRINAAPTIASPAATSGPNPTDLSTIPLTVLGADDGGEANLRYTWSVIGSNAGGVIFSGATQNTTAAQTMVASVPGPGSYQFRVLVRDAQGLNAVSDVVVTRDRLNPEFTWVVQGPVVYGAPLGPEQLGAHSPVQGTWDYIPTLGAVLPAGVHTLQAVFTPNDANLYAGFVATADIEVLRAQPDVTWLQPSPIYEGSALDSAQLNASSSIAGVFAYTPLEGTVLSEGVHRLSVVFTPQDAANFTSRTVETEVMVLSSGPVIVSLDRTQVNATPYGMPVRVKVVASRASSRPITVDVGLQGMLMDYGVGWLNDYTTIERVTLVSVDGNLPTADVLLYWYPYFAPDAGIVGSITLSNPDGCSIGDPSAASIRFIENGPPVSVSPPMADPNPSAQRTFQLTWNVTDDGGPDQLLYQWRLVSGPGGSSFSNNGDSASGSTVVSVVQPGTYIFDCMVTDQKDSEYWWWGGDAPMQYSVLSDPVTVTVNIPENQPPQAAEMPIAVVNATTGKHIHLSWNGVADDFGPEQLAYTWRQVSGPSSAVFSLNGQANAYQTTATVSRAGEYQFECIVSDFTGIDAPSLATTSAVVSVTVNAKMTAAALEGVEGSWKTRMNGGSSAQLAAFVVDQFGQRYAVAGWTGASAQWSMVGGSVTQDGIVTISSDVAVSFAVVTVRITDSQHSVVTSYSSAVNHAPVITHGPVVRGQSRNRAIATVKYVDDRPLSEIQVRWSVVDMPQVVIEPNDASNAWSVAMNTSGIDSCVIRCDVVDSTEMTTTRLIPYQASSAPKRAQTHGEQGAGGVVQFSATVWDQYDAEMDGISVDWSVIGAGSISDSGLYTPTAQRDMAHVVMAIPGTSIRIVSPIPGGLDPSGPGSGDVESPTDVSISVLSGLTGIQYGPYGDGQAAFSNGEAIDIQVVARSNYPILRTELVGVQGELVGADPGRWRLRHLPEGIYRIGARVEVGHAGESVESVGNDLLVLVVDRTAPGPQVYMAAAYRSGADREPIRHSPVDEMEMIYLNANTPADNEKLRHDESRNVFDKAGFALDVAVDDVSGMRHGAQAFVRTATGVTRDLAVAPIVMPDDPDGDALGIGGFQSLPESIGIDPETLQIVSCDGPGDVILVVEDNAGNRFEQVVAKVFVKTTPSTVKWGAVPYQSGGPFQIIDGADIEYTPQHYLVTSTDVVDCWRSGDRYSGTRNMRLTPSTHAVPRSAVQMPLAGWFLDYGSDFGSVEEEKFAANIVVRDVAGNLSPTVALRGDLKTWAAPMPPVTQLPGEYQYGPLSLPLTQQPTTSGRGPWPATYRVEWYGYPVKMFAIDDFDVWFVGAFRGQYEGEGPGEPGITTSLTPQSGMSVYRTNISMQHGYGNILHAPPSWRDPPLRQDYILPTGVFGGTVHAARVMTGIVPQTGAAMWVDGSDFRTGVGQAGAGSDARYVRFSMPTDWTTLRPGAYEVQWSGMWKGYSLQAVANFNVLRVLRMSPDILVAGGRATISLEGPFMFYHLKTVPAFLAAVKSANALRFIGTDGVDMTVPNSQYKSTTEAVRRRKISIVDQRVKLGWNAQNMQRVEFDLEIGPEVAASLLHVDVNIGQIRSTSDPIGIENTGVNGAYRMKEALQIIAVNLQEQKRNDDGTVDTSTWENNFTIEQSKPVVRITSPYDGQSMPDATTSDGSRQVAVSGTVKDIGAEITGQSPTMMINGEAVALSGSNGNYSFSSTVTVAADGLITARATDAWGNVGADESVIARTYTAPPDAVRPANPPETTDVLNGPHGYVFAKNRYSLTVVGASRELTATDVVTGQVTVVSLAAVGSITTTDRDDAPLVIPVFASADGLWRLEEESRVAGTASQRGSVSVTVVRNGSRESRALIETAPASGVFVTQAAEVTLTASAPLTDTVADTLHAVIYRPFMPRIVVDVVETGPATHVFTGGGVTVEMTSAAGYGSPVSVVTAPALGLSGMPVLTPDPEETWESGALVTQSATPVEGGPPSGDSYSDAAAMLPMARMLPEPRAKRITMKLPTATASTVTVKVTTDQGTTHDVVLTRNGDEYRSEPLFYEVGATGARALGGFPMRYEVAGGGSGGTGGGDGGDPPPVVVQPEDVGGDVEIDIVNAAGERLRAAVIRRIPTNSDEDGSHIVDESTPLAGGTKVRLKSGVGVPLSERRDLSKYRIRVDAGTWQQLTDEAQAAVDHAAAYDTLRELEAEEAAAIRAAMGAARGNGDGGWTYVGPRSREDLTAFSQGFGIGMGQQVNETVNPYEIVKGLVELASFVATADWSQIDGGELFKTAIFGHFDECSKQLLAGNFYLAGVSGGRAVTFFASMPLSPKVPGFAASAAAKFQKVMVGYKITLLPRDTGIILRSTFLGVEALVKIQKRIRYMRYNTVLGRLEGGEPARVLVNKQLMDAGIGTKAIQVDWPGVKPSLFESRVLERGHLIPRQFGGRGIRDNLVPMYYRVNQRLIRQAERDVADLVAKGKEVEYIVEPIYANRGSIPSQIKVVARVDGKEVINRVIDNVP